MKNEHVAENMKKRFASIRTSVETMQTRTLRAIGKAAELSLQYARQYNEVFLQEQMQDLRATYNGKIAEIKQIALNEISLQFTAIRTELVDWCNKPMPEATASLIRTYVDFDIIPTRGELQTLIESAQGSYIAMRILDKMAQKAGYTGVDFKTIEALSMDLQLAQQNAIDAIKNYAGILDEKTFTIAADDLGLDVAENRHFVPIAQEFLERADNDFARAEKELCDLTEDTFDLLPSKRRELDALFVDCPDDDARVQIIKNIIESDDTSLCDSLSLHSPELYKRAMTLIADERRSDALKAIMTRSEAEELVEETMARMKAADEAARTA